MRLRFERDDCDLRYAQRALVRALGLSFALLLILALGIGSTTAIFRSAALCCSVKSPTRRGRAAGGFEEAGGEGGLALSPTVLHEMKWSAPGVGFMPAPSYRGGSGMRLSDQYHKWVEWSDEDGAYLGKCPDLITGIHGDDSVKVYADLRDVIEDVIRHFETERRPLPTPHVRPMQEVA